MYLSGAFPASKVRLNSTPKSNSIGTEEGFEISYSMLAILWPDRTVTILLNFRSFPKTFSLLESFI